MSRALGAGLERRKPPVMPVVHRIGLSLPEGDGIGALLRFLVSLALAILALRAGEVIHPFEVIA